MLHFFTYIYIRSDAFLHTGILYSFDTRIYHPSSQTVTNVGKKENVVRYYICPRYVLYVIYYLSSILTTVIILSSVLTNISRLKITKNSETTPTKTSITTTSTPINNYNNYCRTTAFMHAWSKVKKARYYITISEGSVLYIMSIYVDYFLSS